MTAVMAEKRLELGCYCLSTLQSSFFMMIHSIVRKGEIVVSKLITVVFFIVGFGTTSAAANVPLKDVEEISEGLLQVGMADMIRNNCDTISARIIAAALFINGLENRARKLGYSKAEINSYVKNEPEKARLLGIARARLQNKGVILDQPKTYCTVGLAEINARSSIGKLLKAK